MIPVFTSNWYITTERQGTDTVISKTSMCDSDNEKQAYIIANVKNRIIVEAVVNNFRGNHNEVEQPMNIETLEGKDLAGISRLVENMPDEDYGALLLEAVRGALASEGYFFREKGFTTMEEFEVFCAKALKNTCLHWNKWTPDKSMIERLVKRKQVFFSRFWQCSLYSVNATDIFASLLLSDSLQEIAVHMYLDSDLNIQNIKGFFVRAPHDICPNVLEKLDSYNGLNLGYSGIERIFRGADGCSHISDLMKRAQMVTQKYINLR